MEGNPLIQSLHLQNFLSYEEETIGLRPLNVVIGENASGKSNLLEAFRLLRGAPSNIADALNRGGGAQEWIWKGKPNPPNAVLDIIVRHPEQEPLRYYLGFSATGANFSIDEERIENEHIDEHNEKNTFYGYANQAQVYIVNQRIPITDGTSRIVRSWERKIIQGEIATQNQLALREFATKGGYPEIAYLAEQFSRIRSFSELDTGQRGFLRSSQYPDHRDTSFLSENGDNLFIVLTNLDPPIKDRIRKGYERLYESARDFRTRIEGGRVQFYATEEGFGLTVPSARLSDGTLRYFCLLAILCHPSPPPLICIEEPEIGLHPDILPTVADFLIEASERTQLIVTTHSDALISALPAEAVIVCERDEEGSHLQRLSSEDLKEWLEDYALGDLWRRGEIGGTRW